MTNRSLSKRLRELGASHSRSDGGVKRVAADLARLIVAYHLEADRWPGETGDFIYLDAFTLESVRINVLRGIMSPDDAEQWVIAGRNVLDAIQTTRAHDETAAAS